MVVGPRWAARWKKAMLGNLLAARAKRIEKGGGASWAGMGKKEKLGRLTGHAKIEERRGRARLQQIWPKLQEECLIVLKFYRFLV
jgi:hypothetical protein